MARQQAGVTVEPVIRPATEADAETIVQAVRRLGEHVGIPEKVTSTAEDMRRYGFGDDPMFECLIAEIGGEAAGVCIFFRSFSTFNGRPGVYVQDLIVDERFRGAGVGERLLRRAASVTKERGGTYMRLAVDIGNPDAGRFYRRLGLKHVDDDLIYAAYGEAFRRLAEEPPSHAAQNRGDQP